MADLCKACSLKLFGKDFRELANITKPVAFFSKDDGGNQ